MIFSMLGLLTALVLSADALAAENAFADSVVAGRKCKTSSFDDTQLNCTFEVGTAKFEIAGVGATDAQVAIYSADPKATWVAFGLGHQCVMVKNAAVLGVVFVSPKNAKVYTSHGTCSVASKLGR